MRQPAADKSCYLAIVMSCQVAMSSSTTLATMRCQSSLSSEALMSSVGLTLSFHDSSKLSRYFSLRRSLTFLPSILPITTKFSRPCFLNTCPGKLAALDVSVYDVPLPLWILPHYFSYLSMIFFSILCKKQASTAINLSFITLEIVHVSHPYNRTDQT